MLVHRDRLDVLLGNYAVGRADCLADPGLVALAQDYRRKAAARLQPLDEAGLKKLPAADYHVSLKIDGEFNLLVYAVGQAILVNPGGTVRTGLPCLDEAVGQLQQAGVGRAVIAGELWYVPEGKIRERIHDVSRVARNPQSAEELEALAFSAFDVVQIDGQYPTSCTAAWRELLRIGLLVPAHTLCNSVEAVRKQFRYWTELGCEGAVLRSDQAGSYKVKPRHFLDAVVIGFTEGTDERKGMIHDLLLALIRPDGAFQVLGRVGSGFTDQERRDWLCDLADWCVGSDYTESNDAVGYRMVWPRQVIEITVLDVIASTTPGQPILQMCLDWQAVAGDGRRAAVGLWKAIRKLPGAALISPQFLRRRDDKQVCEQDLRLAQLTAIVEVPLADCNCRQMGQPKRTLLRRAAWTKQLKGKTMVRKLVLFKNNKEEPLVAGADPDWPAYVLAVTDYSPYLAHPRHRDIRVSNSRAQIDQLWQEMVREKIVKGWALHFDRVAA